MYFDGFYDVSSYITSMKIFFLLDFFLEILTDKVGWNLENIAILVISTL